VSLLIPITVGYAAVMLWWIADSLDTIASELQKKNRK
jgi:hypothetical protein